MTPVVGNLAALPDADVQAIAVYIAAAMGIPDSAAQQRGAALQAQAAMTGPGTRPQSAGSQTVALGAPSSKQDLGAAIYAGTCASCHDSGRPSPFGGVSLTLSSTLNGSSPANLIRIIRGGVPAVNGARDPIMPGFGAALSDPQLVALVTYLRGHFSKQPPWADIAGSVQSARDAEVAAVPSSPSVPPGTPGVSQ
jgi:mono/diheme cytochrome c family protein